MLDGERMSSERDGERMSSTWQATKLTGRASIPLSGETPLLNCKRVNRKMFK